MVRGGRDRGRLPPGGGELTPDRAARPPFALAATVLHAAGLVLPPLPAWIRLVAISDLAPEEAPRMEAHLAFRAASGRRAGPVRAPLGEWPAERRRRLGRILVDMAVTPGVPPGENVLGSLERAYGLLGLPAFALGRDVASRLGPDSMTTAVEGPPPRAAGSGSPPPGQTAGGGKARTARVRGRGPVPAHLKEAFDAWVDGGWRGEDVPVGSLGWTRPVGSVLRSLAGCEDPFPPERCELLDLPAGSTYADAAEEVRNRLDAMDEVDAANGPSWMENDVYDPEEPMLNPGWPTVIRGMLYRIGDEVLEGMQGQPDLAWDEVEPGEALPPPEDVLAAERRVRDEQMAAHRAGRSWGPSGP